MSYAHTITHPTEGKYSEKGSRFLAYAFPCRGETDFLLEFEKRRVEHPKARHHCYAWRFGETGKYYRANDDGEPSGTAGLPIYNQLQSFDVSDCGVIVVRYFGGTLLGASGLIRAYKTAAQQALKQAKLVKIVPKAQFIATLDYAQVNQLMQFINQFNLNIIKQEMNMPCLFTLEGDRDCLEDIRTTLHHHHIQTHLPHE